MNYKAEDYIMSAMGDDISKRYYEKRIAYNNGQRGALTDIVSMISTGKELIQFMDHNRNHLYVFGAGMLGGEFVRNWNDEYHFKAFVDNAENKSCSKGLFGLPTLLLEQLDDIQAAFVIVSKFYSKEIEEQLIQFGYQKIKFLHLARNIDYWRKVNILTPKLWGGVRDICRLWCLRWNDLAIYERKISEYTKNISI